VRSKRRIAEKHDHIHLVQTVSQTVASWLLIGVKEPDSSYFVEIEAKHTKPGKLEFLLRPRLQTVVARLFESAATDRSAPALCTIRPGELLLLRQDAEIDGERDS
jgi:hypothetical protein